MQKKFDKAILADGIEMSTNCAETMINNNTLVVGGSGSGKTVSYVLPRLLEARHSSLIVTMTKTKIKKMTEELLRGRGYQISCLDFVKPENSTVYWNPLSSIKTWTDCTQLAQNIVLSNPQREKSNDPYWNETATALLSSLIAFCLCKNKNADMADVMNLFHKLKCIDDSSARTTLDNVFEEFEKVAGSDHYVIACWRIFYVAPFRTASCILSTLAATLNTLFTEDVCKLLKKDDKKRKLEIESLANQKEVLFLITSPVNKILHCLVNIFYSMAFGRLFEYAQEQENEELDVPVHFIADDFATGCVVNGFDEYISVFRAAGISVSLLIQSEAQLEDIYGNKARTIIDNCDTYLFYGCNDIRTAKTIAEKVDKATCEVLNMPIGKEIFMQRGQKPRIVNRYRTLEDERYKKLVKYLEASKKVKGIMGQRERAGA